MAQCLECFGFGISFAFMYRHRWTDLHKLQLPQGSPAGKLPAHPAASMEHATYMCVRKLQRSKFPHRHVHQVVKLLRGLLISQLALEKQWPKMNRFRVDCAKSISISRCRGRDSPR